jgi:hypothetical protein
MRTMIVLGLGLALGACSSTMTQEQAMARYGTTDPATIAAIQQRNYNQTMNNLTAMNSQMQQNVAMGWVTLSQGQQPPAVGNYQYQGSDGSWVYCVRVSASVVNCRQ